MKSVNKMIILGCHRYFEEQTLLQVSNKTRREYSPYTEAVMRVEWKIYTPRLCRAIEEGIHMI